MKYFSGFYISYWRRTLTRKETDNMELVIQWLLFILGERNSLGDIPPPGPGEEDPINTYHASGG